MTPQEVAEAAFEGSFGISAERIGEAPIISAQHKFIKPALGKLYQAIEKGKYPELKPMLKAALSQYVKLLLIPQLAVSMGNTGITEIKSPYFSSVNTQRISAIRNTTRAEACAMMRNLTEYIETNRELYPEYHPEDNILNKISICAGIIM